MLTIRSLRGAFAIQLGITFSLSTWFTLNAFHAVIIIENIDGHFDHCRGGGVKEAVVRKAFCLIGESITSKSTPHTPASPGEGSL